MPRKHIAPDVVAQPSRSKTVFAPVHVGEAAERLPHHKLDLVLVQRRAETRVKGLQRAAAAVLHHHPQLAVTQVGAVEVDQVAVGVVAKDRNLRLHLRQLVGRPGQAQHLDRRNLLRSGDVGGRGGVWGGGFVRFKG